LQSLPVQSPLTGPVASMWWELRARS